RELILAGSQWYVSTIIIVDRIGANSRISRLAESVGGTIVQMSMGYWPQQVARDLHRVLGYEHPLVNMDQAEIGEFLKKAMLQVPLEDIIRLTEV
ncbi:MAG: hypothetical protein KIT87_18535, partial [Anaerolineae bacterium]|nr:hypothetical protein [Anaerolineae bacterium]